MTLMGSCETALHPLQINDEPTDWEYLLPLRNFMSVGFPPSFGISWWESLQAKVP
jgi:hypothetical protein